MTRPPLGLIALSIFFGVGAVIAGATLVALLTPGGIFEPMWRLNAAAHAAFIQMGPLASALMACVAVACACTAVGLWLQARWGHRLAILLLVVNCVGDAINAFVRGDLRTLIGVPIAGLLVAYLLTPGVRANFPAKKAAGQVAG